jgi:hypothetical protein
VQEAERRLLAYLDTPEGQAAAEAQQREVTE